ncbi:MAG: hypothetical protein CMH31_03585 [Micavibrio sp.]|nr:hypothetical protein [Micavibrio sp.]|tara:strand:- start:266 stop:1267 length:1002 start_codon:yes stop_codon:yes gene_type:complete
MRLGVLKNILDFSIDENKHITFQEEALYGGQRYLIKDFYALMDSLDNILDMSWAEDNNEVVKRLISEHGKTVNSVEISAEDRNLLHSMLTPINQHMPVFYSILENLVERQDEQIINIKIPSAGLKTLKEVSAFNNQLDDVFDLVIRFKGFQGDVEFVGVDVGTSWYKILLVGAPYIYGAFLGTLNIAHELIDLREKWYKSEDLRMDVEIKKEELNDKKAKVTVTDKDIREHVQKKVKKKMELEVDALIENVPVDFDNEPEMKISICKGIEKIIPLLEAGTEFQPSLNPPKYIDNVSDDGYEIDYDGLRKFIEKNAASIADGEVKQIEDKSDDE